MAARIAVVTDTTAGLTVQETRRFGIFVVPLTVVVDGQPFAETSSVTPAEVVAALRKRTKVTTSRPAPGRFLELFDNLSAAGVEHVVCVHLSAAMSGTYDAARVAGASAPVPVTVIDSGLLGRALGRSVLAAARCAARGGSAAEVSAVARAHAGASQVLFYVDTMEYLWRGGRIRAGDALLGTALHIKPVLHMIQGRAEAVDRPRSATKGLARLAELAAAAVPGAPCGDVVVDVDVQHCDAAARARGVAEAVTRRIAAPGDVTVTPAGAVLSVHAGPGLVGVSVSPARTHGLSVGGAVVGR